MRLIDADALIEKLEAWKKEAERRDANINYTFASAIIAQVNVEPTIEERKWIPCSERLPKDVQIGDEYPAVIFCTKEKTYAGFYEYYLDGRWWAEDGDYVVDDVIAWMPLPKPYKGGQDGH